MNRLMLGCGIHKRAGWKTLDANPHINPDYLAMLPQLPKVVTDVKWDEVEWIHGIGSLCPWEGAEVLRKLRACMAPDGLLVLEQPDLRKALSCAATSDSVRWLFGDPIPRDPLIMNRWAYTPEQLVLVVQEAGFTRVEILPAQYHVPSRDFRIEARP